MKQLLMICPTRGRPEKALEMLASFKATRTFADIVFYVADDDPYMEDYCKNILDFKIRHGERLPIARVFDLLSKDYPHDYFGEINDDHIFHTKGWDEIFVDAIEARGKGWGIAFGHESNTPYWQPSGSVISTKCIKALGHYVTPYLEHLFIDRYFIDLYKPLELLLKCPEVNIEHVHWTFGKAKIDQNYKELYQDEQNFNRQQELYYKWHREQMSKDIEILKSAMAKEI